MHDPSEAKERKVLWIFRRSLGKINEGDDTRPFNLDRIRVGV